MAPVDQPKTTLSDTTAQKRFITDYVSLIDPDDTPLVNKLGPSSALAKFKFVNHPSLNPIWLTDAYRAYTGAALSASILSTALTLPLGDSSYLVAGDVVQIEDEKLWVSAVSVSGNTATVTRAFGGTTAATHESLLGVTVLYRTHLDGADATYGPLTTIASDYNYVATLYKTLSLTRQAQKITQYGIAGEWDYQAAKGIPEMMRDLERMLFHGVRSVATATVAASSGGLGTFATTNTFSTTASTLTAAMVEGMILSCYNAGGKPDLMVCSPLRMLTLQNLFHTSSWVQFPPEQKTVGMAIQNWLTPYGTMALMMSRQCPTTKLFILDVEHVGIYEFEAPAWEPLAKTGTKDNAQLVADYSLCMKHDTAHAVITLS